jgi:uncharacterized damage-inducible protein DinB
MTIGQNFLDTAIKRVSYYKELGDKTFAQLADADFYWQPNESSNSIAIIIQHMAGNMLSRWTNFLSEDGEKEWRNRDEEFEQRNLDRKELLALWEKGWACFLDTLKQLNEEDLLKNIYIRSEPLTVTDAINRQLAHYPYHVGQIVYLGRMIKDAEWKNLSIPKGQSQQYNKDMGKQK